MGRYDDISPEELPAQLLRLARLIHAMEKKNILLQETWTMLRLLGELRQMIFAYEVRGTRALLPENEVDATPSPDPTLDDSLRIVSEALDRERELLKELESRSLPNDSES